MPSKKPYIMIRTHETIIEKFKVICEEENRSVSNKAETMIIELIKAYESEHGEIQIEKHQD